MTPSQLATVDSPVGLPEDQKDLSLSEIEKVYSPGQQTAAEVDVVGERKLVRKVSRRPLIRVVA